jgi:hypothetical protein
VVGAGGLLAEVREVHFSRDAEGFYAWAEKNFNKKRTQIKTYMAAATAADDKLFKNLEDFRRRGLGHQTSARSSGRTFRDWTAPVDAVAERARVEQRRLAQEEFLTRQQEREAESKLGLPRFWRVSCIPTRVARARP